MELTDIIGNEHAKRAVEIALKGDLKILFIGNSEADDFVTYLKEAHGNLHTVVAKGLQPCKCGYFGSERIVCTCKPEQVLKQRRAIDNMARNWADMVVRTISPNSDKVKKWVEENYKDLETESISLLMMGYDKLNLTVPELKKVIKVSQTIAEMDNSKKVLTQHIAEALQYRNKD